MITDHSEILEDFVGEWQLQVKGVCIVWVFVFNEEMYN